MRKTIFGLLLISVCVAESCQKAPPADPGGSWSFKGVNYTARYCTGDSSTAVLSALDSIYTGVKGSVNVIFFNVLPINYGTYTVVKGRSPSNPQQVTLSAYIGPAIDGHYYQSTGGDGNETVSVTYSNGKISLTGTGIEMSDTTHTPDSAAMSINIVQQQ
jgi:hypothetical protein